MYLLSTTAAVLAFASSINAVQKGFKTWLDYLLTGGSYGATNNDGSCRVYNDFKSQFTTAKSLPNAPGFTSARLYTSIQCGSTNAPIEAIKAALDTNTNLLLGLWASAGQAAINNEIAAIKTAAQNWPAQMKQRVVGISVGSEDLYRSSPQGQANNAGVGATSAQIVSYISQVRSALKGTVLAGKKIGHVDTWTAWILSENAGTIGAVDFLGHNGFPYFETTHTNPISNAKQRFQDGLAQTEGVAGGKPVWVTETGWPWKGAKSGQAVASVKNAKTYWDQVGCSLFGTRNTWWYTLVDANTAQTDISFAVAKSPSGVRFNLQCPA